MSNYNCLQLNWLLLCPFNRISIFNTQTVRDAAGEVVSLELDIELNPLGAKVEMSLRFLGMKILWNLPNIF